MEWLDWHECYEDGWKGVIVDGAFSHPAKAARGLLRRIFGHLETQGWLPARSRVLDVFGGIGTTAIEGASRGHEVCCIELEEHYYKLALENFARHRRVWEASGDPLPAILHGDSRRAVELMRGHFAACVSSPPYNGAFAQTHLGRAGGTRGTESPDGGFSRYGNAPGQLEGLPEGEFAAVVSSPPYEGNNKHDYLMSANGKTRARDERRGFKQGQGCFRGSETAYGHSPGQLGVEQAETFWLAARTILEQVFQLLRAGGVCAWIVKDNVRDRQRVPICDNWARLSEAVGFRVVQRARCWQVKEEVHAGLFGDVKETKTRKSFFCQLNDQKPGAIRVDYEEVIFAMKGPR